MKIKKIFPFLTVFPLFLSSCNLNNNSQQNQINQLKIQENEKEDKEWNEFINSDFITNILNVTFDSEDKKNQFIKEQKELDIKTTFLDIKNWLYYYTTIQNNTDDGFISKKALPYSQSLAKIKELTSKNWLFFLFNLNKIVFIQLADTTNLFAGTKEEQTEKSRENLLTNPLFYISKDNKILDFAILKTQDNLNLTKEELEEEAEDYQQDFKFYFVNYDGLLFEMELTKEFDENKNNTSNKMNFILWADKIKKWNVKNNKSNFDIQKYVKEKESRGLNSNSSAISLEIFLDNLGGKPIRYTFADLKL
ncbi:aromatic motif membrane protein [Mycoplasma sp. AC157]